jgi:radical SAM enzyme (TIGR01210 family)
MSESDMDGQPEGGTVSSYVAELYDMYGQRKPMGKSSPVSSIPHFFLLRTFLGENDLLVILSTKRCRYQCAFCRLPAKSVRSWVSDDDILAQFRYVVSEVRHALSILDRVTLSNEGSVLDEATFGGSALRGIVSAIGAMRRVRRIDLETRIEFVDPGALRGLQELAPRTALGILTGFETRNPRIRDEILKKREPLSAFLAGMDNVQRAGAALTSYVLFKPDPQMTDTKARTEAMDTIEFLAEESAKRGIDLTVRLNPMYRAAGSLWAHQADASLEYQPPRLTDIMEVAEWATSIGVKVYIGLSAEGLAEDNGTYRARDDYAPALIKHVKLFNDGHIQKFDWADIKSPQMPGTECALAPLDVTVPWA